MKHIRLKLLFVREHVTAGEFLVNYLPGKQMPADCLTKPLSGETIEFLLRMILAWGGEPSILDTDTPRHAKRPRLL